MTNSIYQSSAIYLFLKKIFEFGSNCQLLPLLLMLKVPSKDQHFANILLSTKFFFAEKIFWKELSLQLLVSLIVLWSKCLTIFLSRVSNCYNIFVIILLIYDYFYYLGWKIMPPIPCDNNWTSMEGYWILFGNFQLQWQGSKEINWQFQLLFGQITWGFLVWGYFGYFDAGIHLISYFWILSLPTFYRDFKKLKSFLLRSK